MAPNVSSGWKIGLASAFRFGRWSIAGPAWYVSRADALGFLGHDNVEQNVYIATGDSGHGMTHGTIAGMLITDLICGRNNGWTAIYNPCRINSQAASEYLSENADVVAELLDWFTPGDVPSEENIAPGCG